MIPAHPLLDDKGGFEFPDGYFARRENTRDIGSVSQLLDHLALVKGASNREVWFRGQQYRSWELKASFYRDAKPILPEPSPEYDDNSISPHTYDIGDLDSLLKLMQKHLQANGQERVHISDALMIAQHHPMSTPLLDWSTNPLVAVWFAIQDSKKLDPNDPPVLWMLDPQFANTRAPFKFGDGLASSPGIPFELLVNELVENETSLAHTDIPQDAPVAVFTDSDFSTRIGRQAGKFTFAGPHRIQPHISVGLPLHAGSSGHSFAPLYLDAKRAPAFLEELALLGICEETIYGSKRRDEDIKAALHKAKLTHDGRTLAP